MPGRTTDQFMLSPIPRVVNRNAARSEVTFS